MRRNILVLLIITALSISSAVGQSSDHQTAVRPMWQMPLEERLEQHVYALSDDSLKGREAGSEYGYKAAKYIAQQFEESGIEPLLDGYMQKFELEPSQLKKLSNIIIPDDGKPLTCRNVVGIIYGSHPILRNEYIIIGAHYDHIGTKTKGGKEVVYGGADDNASGVASIIEIGRTLRERQGELNRSVILVAFDAEEVGLQGAEHFMESEAISMDRVKLMVNLDMVGWHKESGMLTYYASGTLEDDLELFDPNEIPAGLTVDVKEYARHNLGGLDSDPFYEAGIPVLMATTGKVSPYHKPEDSAEKIDYDGMAHIAQHIEHLSIKASSMEKIDGMGEQKRKTKVKSKLPLFRFGVTASVGANSHHYTKGSINGKNKAIYSGGLYTDIRMSRSGVISLRPEVSYERVGAKHPDGTMWTNGVVVPLNIVINTPPIIPVGLQLAFGGYYTHKFSGHQGGHRVDFANTYYRNEAGLSWGISMKLSPVTFGVRVRYALTNFTRHKLESGAHIKNRATMFTMSYEF